jgi:hypothetical protein
MSDKILTPVVEEETGLIAYMFTNDAKQGYLLQQLLDMYYRGAYSNTIGIMSALNTETEETELLIVGVSHDEEGLTNTFPLARILTPQEVEKYRGPDGKGGWLDGVTSSEGIFGDAANDQPVN